MALQLGMSHATLCRTIPADEMPYWLALWQIDPWGDVRAEASRAIVGSAVCASMGAKIDPRVMLPNWDREPTPRGMTADDFRAYAEAHNDKIFKGERGRK